jgi:hypothetical protein
MANNQLGDLRRSAVVMIHGPGSVVDFRAEGAPVSVVAAGLEEWDKNFPPQGLRNPQAIFEPRLQKKLNVGGFRLPPVFYNELIQENGLQKKNSLIGVRFPDWLQCPECDRIAPSVKWGSDPGKAYRYCATCTARRPGQRKVFAIPVRFIMACEAGHLDDFPWHYWVGHHRGCTNTMGPLTLRAMRPGLAGLILACPECNARRSMEGVFGKDTWKSYICSGKKPWLAAKPETCINQQPRALQRGASNLYFPVIDSALSIPPWSDILQEAIGVYWHDIAMTEPAKRAMFIDILAQNALRPVLEEFGLTSKKLAALIEERLSLLSGEQILDIRKEEYRQLTSRIDSQGNDDREFEIRNVAVPDTLSLFFSHIVKAVRIREIRALRGFTRINPPGNENDQSITAISENKLDWLPAVEVRGEGIFIAFNSASLAEWEKQEIVRERAERINISWHSEWNKKHGDSEPDLRITARYLLIHSFAHALMRQLTLECGYSSAALRERLYVSEDYMSGLLIYTATSDSDGTLGGLQRQGESTRIERVVKSSIRAMEWCSSDPLCITGMVSTNETHSLAACHSCLYVPETACEQFNRFLDRAMLIGLPESSKAGFFVSMLSGE